MATNDTLADNSFLTAIDNHNIANGDPSWFQQKVDGAIDLATGVAQAATYGVADAAIAGAISIKNTASAFGNFLGMDTEQTVTGDVIKSLDSDLGAYYDAHKEGVEIGGFVLGSILPGMAGIKAMQAAKGAILGTNMIRSLGLTESLTADYAAAAKAEFSLSSSPFSILNANTVKALAQGFGSEVLDAAAFNTAATAAMYKSPMFDGQSISDMFWDDVTGSLIWGGVGGAVRGVKTVYGINKGIQAVKGLTFPEQFIRKLPNEEAIAKTDPVMPLLNAFDNKFRIKDSLPNISAEGNDIALTGITDEQLITLRQNNATTTLNNIDNDIRGYLNNFSKGDTVVGNALFEATKEATKIEDIYQALGPSAKSAGRIGTEDTIASSDVYYLQHGKSYEDFQKVLNTQAHDELLTGTASGENSKAFQVVGDLNELKVTGVKSEGLFSAGSRENAFANGYDIFRNGNGTLSVNPQSQVIKQVFDKPIENRILVDLTDGTTKFKGVPGLADLASKENPIVVKGDTVLAGKLSPIKIGNSLKYSPLDAMPHEAQARTIWAQKAPLQDGMRVGQNDLPLMERIYQEDAAGSLGSKVFYRVTEQTPNVIPGYTRLYRGESDNIKGGNWFSSNKDTAKFYGKDLSYVDVPTSYAHSAEFHGDGKDITRGILSPDFINKVQPYIETGVAAKLPSGNILKNLIEDTKQKLFQEGATSGMPLDELSTRLNTSDKYLTGEHDDGWMNINQSSDIQKPRYAKITYDPSKEAGIPMMNTMNHTGALDYAQKVENIKQIVEQNAAAYLGEMNSLFPDAIKASDPVWNSASQGSGASLFGFANANYGTMGAFAQYVGNLVDRLLTNKKTLTAENLNKVFSKATIKSPEVQAEAALINNELRRRGGMVFHPDGSDTLIPKAEYEAVASGKMEPSEHIDISNPEAAEVFRQHVSSNAERQEHIANMKGTAGVRDNFDSNVVYPIPIKTQDLKHFVLVKPLAPVSLADKSRVIAAKDEATLKQLVASIDKTKFEVQTKAENVDFHKSIGDYDSSLGMNDSIVDSALTREGTLSQHFPNTNNFFDEMTDWHMRQEELLARSMVYHKYSQMFEELKSLGSTETNVATSQFGFLSKGLEQSVKDPYNDIIKTALNISRTAEYKSWTNFNQFVKDAIEKPVNKIAEVWKGNTKIDPDFVNKVNKISQEMGQGQVYKDTANMLVANGNIPDKPWLSLGIAKVQSVLSTTLLQWDTMNAINNIMGNAILSGPEARNVLNAIKSGNRDIAGKLTDLMSVKVPASADSSGTPLVMPTVGKLIRNAVGAYADNGEAKQLLIDRFRSINTITDLSQIAKDSFNHLLIDWKNVNEGQAQTAIEKAADFGRKWTGNQRAEEFNRFVASHIMMQLTDMAQEAGTMSAKESNEYIQMFVSRTQGNHLYSQRPIVFQGVVGQAISLFQTYQFNLMQQLFKYVAEGNSKTASMLLGLQGSIYGMNGMPAFNFLNTHIVGNASGNTAHKDLFDAAYSVAGKEMGDWLLYGAGSNALGIVDPSLKTNLYSRGDINPRQLTVLPTTLSDIPVISASMKFVQNLYNAGEKIASGGAVWPSISQAIEHNGLSRPLSGLAASTQGYTTSGKGALLSGGQDFFSIATLTRLAGAKPFDESTALDRLYRINAYKASDSNKIQALSASLRSTLVAGGTPTPDQIGNFASEYAKSGGKIDNFNGFFANAALTANRSQVNALAFGANTSYAKQFQIVMGGKPLPDYTNVETP